MLARMACQQPRRPQLMRIAVVLGLVASQRHQPSFGFRCNRWLLARSRSIIKCRERAVGHRPLDAALDRLMMRAKLLSNRTERWSLTIGQQHLGSYHPTRRLGPRARKSRQCPHLVVTYRKLDRSPPSRHDTAPRSISCEQGIRQSINRSMNAGFMESIV